MDWKKPTKFKTFCIKYMPFLLITCPVYMKHFIWENRCTCEDRRDPWEFTFNYINWNWDMVKK